MITLISWIDRNFNLLFNKDKCLIMNWYTFEGKDLCKYNTIVKDPFGHKFRSLGKRWFKALPLLLLPLFSYSQVRPLICNQCGDVINKLPHRHKITNDLDTMLLPTTVAPSYVSLDTFVTIKPDTIKVAILASNKESDSITPRGHDYNSPFVIYGYQIIITEPHFYISYESSGRRVKNFPHEIRLVNQFFEPLDNYIIWSVKPLYDE